MKIAIAFLALVSSVSVYAEPSLESCRLLQTPNFGYSVEISGLGDLNSPLTAIVGPIGHTTSGLIGEFSVREIPQKRLNSRLYAGLGIRLSITDDFISLRVITENEEVEISGPKSELMSCRRN